MKGGDAYGCNMLICTIVTINRAGLIYWLDYSKSKMKEVLINNEEN